MSNRRGSGDYSSRNSRSDYRGRDREERRDRSRSRSRSRDRERGKERYRDDRRPAEGEKKASKVTFFYLLVPSHGGGDAVGHGRDVEY